MSEGKQANSRRGSVAVWAWTVSIVIHLAVLGVFAFIKISQLQVVEKQRITPTAKVSQSQVKQLAEAEPVSPKPKVKKPIISCAANTMVVKAAVPANQIFNVSDPIVRSSGGGSGVSVSAASPKVIMPLSASATVTPKVEFFGSVTEGRKICYVVDCSGSMRGTFGRVQKELIKSIERLEADRYFYVIFFAADKLFEYGQGKLIRATPQAKSAVREFIESVQAAGATNAMAALERAMQIRDGRGTAPAIIYFLTDGFELTSDNAYGFADKVLNMRKSFAPATKINTIGFWVQKADGRILERIAKQSGGDCVLVND